MLIFLGIDLQNAFNLTEEIVFILACLTRAIQNYFLGFLSSINLVKDLIFFFLFAYLFLLKEIRNKKILLRSLF